MIFPDRGTVPILTREDKFFEYRSRRHPASGANARMTANNAPRGIVHKSDAILGLLASQKQNYLGPTDSEGLEARNGIEPMSTALQAAA